MTMATYFYPSAKLKIATGLIDLDTDSFYAMLVTDAYTPAAAHDFRDDVTNELAASGNYVAGGFALAGITVALSGTEARFDANDLSIASASFTARGCVIYKRRGGAASADELVSAHTFGADITSSGGTFVIAWDATGIDALT